ncbi:hypothetical protein Tco_0161506, partial [Tanacetum coccineum]
MLAPTEIGVTAAAFVPFVTSSVTPTPEREGGRHGDSVTGPNLRLALSILRDSASTCDANQDIAGPSHLVGIELSTDSFFVLQDVDSETLHQIYIPKWNVTNDSALDDPDICRVGWLKERDAEIASLKAQLSLKEAEAAEAIRLRDQVAVVEAAEAARASEL